MASFGSETASEAERKKRRDEFSRSHPLPSLFARMVDPKSNWVLVPEGSFMGYFDWCPKRLRVGPWSPLAPIYLTAFCLVTFYIAPSTFHVEVTQHSFPEAFTWLWYYNVAGFLWMSGVLFVIVTGPAGPFVMITYTLQSWAMLILRHGLSALAPFLSSDSILVKINEMIRFPALASATITFVVWNFAIGPFVYFFAMDTPEKRRKFLHWNLSFKLTQIHAFNIVFATLNAVVASPKTFHFHDWWCSLLCTLVYSLLYVLFLDRLGIHLYPIFSPRSHAFVLTWSGGVGLICVARLAWNRVIERMLV